jgi:putative ATPase
MVGIMDRLFDNENNKARPLAYRLRPSKLEEFVGQEHILGKDTVLHKLLSKKKIINSIFYGPPGTGKTSLAHMIAGMLSYDFLVLNATTTGVNDIKKIALSSEEKLKIENKKTLLFLDEIHRFSKNQQDVLLDYIEKGSFVLIGATTENPYYNLNNALISRVILYKFEKLKNSDIEKLIKITLKKLDFELDIEIIDYLVYLSGGDGRTALNYVELLFEIREELSLDDIKKIIGERKIKYDKSEDKYNIISAFIKSIRGSNPDAAVYWLGRMLAGGEDPRYIARRLLILASEDIGMANPEALNIGASTLAATEKIGMPEIRIILSQATIYMAISTKSNSCYLAINKALSDGDNLDELKVPRHLTSEYKDEYIYPHDYKYNFVKQEYIGRDKRYYIPGNNKNEVLIREKLEKLWGWSYE